MHFLSARFCHSDKAQDKDAPAPQTEILSLKEVLRETEDSVTRIVLPGWPCQWATCLS